MFILILIIIIVVLVAIWLVRFFRRSDGPESVSRSLAAQGLDGIEVVRFQDMFDLTEAAKAGDKRAEYLAKTYASFFSAVADSADTVDDYAICVCCRQPLGHVHFSAVFENRYRSGSNRARVAGICADCSTDSVEIATMALRAHPELRYGSEMRAKRVASGPLRIERDSKL
jgi:hypothetical protein